ncbi:MAG: oxygen-independent coproporphyrinogen III oxidase [Thiotrichales bacterium]|jgi:oxygen-independent coproporphyrinogen-3 oxidase|nr:oxygen-independent coproporphyrinogen III oxidase [Thiotrichales bacterium]MBT3613553.1 oxygen-independent coproporphyrinogen III oxidase [Thiotrichales bacterium]MBT3752361.1 oxygen-independent coproporphyrinogen III oxidase [Thiotrichales bacterium]MBT3838033.1 oxygen-independent coproporphyrinogen III oxidase [Thiotrichales bacterium]MBT4152132.1 oxygen-independent coproporphyrinogen III oxidase [Thiotrichales bacterium]
MEQILTFDMELIRRYDKAGPRYTSYPTAVQFDSKFNANSYREAVARTNSKDKLRPISLYFHIPFCDTVCFYCGCNKIATKDRTKSPPYLDRVIRELELQGEIFDKNRVVDQLHWGGGTPTFLNHDEISRLMDATRANFNLRDDDEGEYSIEIDPREATVETVALLRKEGFNRMSLGLQDFDSVVQKAVNRIQSEEETFAVLNAARDSGFKSISIDLIYGLPHQTADSFQKTVDKVLSVRPDRLSVFNYAHLPEIFKPQRRINEDDLPTSDQKLEILQRTNQQLSEAGYLYIGMDHFALPDDELAVAQREGTLYRNFQGYSTHRSCDLVGIGVTSIGVVGNSYSQNIKELDGYYEAIDNGELPIFRGVELDADDLLRRDVITELICNFKLTFSMIEQQHSIKFSEYFAQEIEDLKDMEKDGLLTMDSGSVTVATAGRLLIRNVCMVFDRYLREKQIQNFSKVI